MMLARVSASLRVLVFALLAVAAVLALASPVVAEALTADIFTYDEPVDVAPGSTAESPGLVAPATQLERVVAPDAGSLGHLYDSPSSFVAPNSSTVYRVQGGVPPAASQTRIGIGSAGELTVSGDGMLFVTIDDLGRAQAFATNNRPGASIIAFDVDPAFVTQVRNAAVPQSQARNFPGAPQIADPLQTSGSFGLPAEWIQRLQDAAIPGTGRAVG